MRRRGKSGRKPSQSLDWIMRTRGSDNLCDLRTALGRKTGGPAGAFVGRLSEDKRARIGRKRGLKAQGINGPRASWAFRGQVMARVTQKQCDLESWCRWRGSNPHTLTSTRF